MAPDTLPARWDSTRLSSSSLPRQGWSRLSPSYAPPAEAGPSHQQSWRHRDSAADESDRSHRQPSLSQDIQNPPHSSRVERAANPASGRRATVTTQPVLVRAYSGNAEPTTAKSSTMSPRRLFPFTGSRSAAPSRPSGPPLPNDKDFSIESILQAIEPDIKGTLDSIAEICGRSKLSLANEYGSHIAPLGEIRAPPGGLVPVEEASSSDERRADEGVTIFEDDPNLVDGGRDLQAFSFYGYMETLRQAASLEHNGAAAPGPSNPTRPAVPNRIWDAVPDLDMPLVPATREFASKPRNSGRGLLAKGVASGRDESQSHGVVTPAVVSEVHLDAQADDRRPDHGPDILSSDVYTAGRSSTNEWQAPEVIRSLIGWLKWTARVAGPEAHPKLQSAEGRLRAMLAQSLDDGPTAPAV